MKSLRVQSKNVFQLTTGNGANFSAVSNYNSFNILGIILNFDFLCFVNEDFLQIIVKARKISLNFIFSHCTCVVDLLWAVTRCFRKFLSLLRQGAKIARGKSGYKVNNFRAPTRERKKM